MISDAAGMRRLAARVGALDGWRRGLLTLAMGALAAFALPPYYVLPALVPAFVVLLWLLEGNRSPWRAALAGWLFGLGYFVVALHWVGHAFLVDPERFAAVMPFAIAGLSGGLALFPALASALALLAPPGWLRLLALASGWALAEWLRGWLFTGFPWDPVGMVWFASDATAQGFALLGVQGVGFLTLIVAMAPARLGRRRDLAAVLLLFALVPLLYGAGSWRLSRAQPALVDGIGLRLVQGNIPQDEKWQRGRQVVNFRHYLELTAGSGGARPNVVVWPETATAFFLDEEPEARRAAGALLAPGGYLLTGAPRRSRPAVAPFEIWNSLLALAPSGAVLRTYDKHHLVPFGEYLPFRALLSRVGLDKLTPGSIDYAAGDGPVRWQLPGLPALQPLICYETIFPSEIGRPRAEWLLNVTNDAWFGTGAGPRQHLAHARARAIELGLPMVRVANTGVSAVIDPWGRILHRLDLGVTGVIDAGLPRPLARPPAYATVREYWLVLPALFLIFYVVSAFRQRN